MDGNKEINYVEVRRAICNSCEHLKTYIGIKTCDKCGCSIWAKSMLPYTKCPEGKWNAE